MESLIDLSSLKSLKLNLMSNDYNKYILIEERCKSITKEGFNTIGKVLRYFTLRILSMNFNGYAPKECEKSEAYSCNQVTDEEVRYLSKGQRCLGSLLLSSSILSSKFNKQIIDITFFHKVIEKLEREDLRLSVRRCV